MIDEINKNAKNIADSNTAEANAVARKNIILSVIIGILSIVFAYVLTKYITGMVGKLTEVSQKVAKGEVNVNVEVESSDEFGKLAQAMQDLIGSIKGIIDDANKFYNEQKLGDIDYFIDVKKYNGAYREVANSINEAANMHIQNILKILNILNKYADGDFSQQLEKLPGKQIVVNQAMDKLRENLANMLVILNEMSKKVEQNDLNFRIDASKLEGEFKKNVEGLNKMIDIVREPIRRIAESVNVVASSANQISSSTEQMAAGAQESSQQTLEVASAVEEMTKTILETSQNTTRA
ncbi:MAG TPA: HAMP domain-containing protein, partial [Ignavibacteriales bacterium]|nr:HAMP domain-containing protein [Ignavibacteriales bacterium]